MSSIPQGDADVKHDTIVLVVEYEGSKRYLRNSGTIIEVCRNDNPARPPKNSDLDAAIRWLAAKGYQPVPEQTRSLDRAGVTTFRPRRLQTYQKKVEGNVR